MEMVRDQADKATTGWPGFGFHPTSKHSAQKEVENLNSKWFYREVNKIITLGTTSLSFLKICLSSLSLNKFVLLYRKKPKDQSPLDQINL